MKELDIQGLEPREQQLLELSFEPEHSEKRVPNILWSALVLFAGLLLFSLYGSGLRAITGLALVIVIISSIEKLTHAREMLSYKSLVRALARRLEDAQGITPSGEHRVDRSRLAAGRARAKS